ncbi:MAG: MOSC domain-containing protein [Candidatus Hydrogenedentes bacterium]|nr:MOSC domain-containing protein [Candidatus Hydrogenedentota bacterium]
MRVRSVNVSRVTQVFHEGELVSTGIFKRPVEGSVAVGREQIAGDEQADLRHHGGPDKAVYGYPWEHYATWGAALGRDDFAAGQFGENLTTEGLLETEVCIGDQLEIGSVRLEVSQPRMPCFKLGIRMKLPGFPKQFLRSGRVGFYFRVLSEGTLCAGDPIILTPSAYPRLSVSRVSDLRFFDRANHAEINRILENPALSATWRADFEDLIAAGG